MKPSREFHTLCQRLLPLEAIEDEDAVVMVVVNAEEEPVELDELKLQDTEEQSTLTYRLESGRGVECTSNGGDKVFSVQNPQPVLGRMFTLPNLPSNER